jgi:hypothetical protein
MTQTLAALREQAQHAADAENFAEYQRLKDLISEEEAREEFERDAAQGRKRRENEEAAKARRQWVAQKLGELASAKRDLDKLGAELDAAPARLAAATTAFRDAFATWFQIAEELGGSSVSESRHSHEHRAQTLLKEKLRYHKVIETGLGIGKEPESIVAYLAPILDGIRARLEKEQSR